MSSSAGLSDNGTAGGDKRFDPFVGDIGGEADDEVGADCAGELHVSHRSCGVGQPIPVDDINHGRRSAGHLQCKCVDVLLRPLQRTPCRSRKRRRPCSSLGPLPQRYCGRNDRLPILGRWTRHPSSCDGQRRRLQCNPITHIGTGINGGNGRGLLMPLTHQRQDECSGRSEQRLAR